MQQSKVYVIPQRCGFVADPVYVMPGGEHCGFRVIVASTSSVTSQAGTTESGFSQQCWHCHPSLQKGMLWFREVKSRSKNCTASTGNPGTEAQGPPMPEESLSHRCHSVWSYSFGSPSTFTPQRKGPINYYISQRWGPPMVFTRAGSSFHLTCLFQFNRSSSAEHRWVPGTVWGPGASEACSAPEKALLEHPTTVLHFKSRQHDTALQPTN